MAEITKKSPPRPFSVPNPAVLLLCLLTIVAYVVGLDLPLVGPDEPRYAQVAREMFERGDWITPTLGGHTWFEKPALLYWLEISAYNLFGVTEFAARLGPALCGIGTIAAAYFLGIAVGRKELAIWLAMVTASSFGILTFAHGASFDIVITFAIAASLVGFAWYELRGKDLGLLTFYFFIGVALLAKGLIGVAFPVGIVGFYFIINHPFPNRRFFTLAVPGLWIAAAVAASWYIPVYLKNGWHFIDEFVIQHHFQRFLSNKYQHPQPFYFFFWVLPLMTLPWLGFVAAGIYRSVKEFRSEDDISIARLRSLAFAWVFVPLAFFSISGSKLPGYILPAAPGLLIFAGLWLWQASRAWKLAGLATAATTLIVVITIIVTVAPRFAAEESVKPLFSAATQRGFSTEHVYAVHSMPHGAEFYAEGRLLREANGDQRKIYSGQELKTEMERAGVKRALAIVPTNYPDDITAPKFFRCEMLASNGEWAIYSIELL